MIMSCYAARSLASITPEISITRGFMSFKCKLQNHFSLQQDQPLGLPDSAWTLAGFLMSNSRHPFAPAFCPPAEDLRA